MRFAVVYGDSLHRMCLLENGGPAVLSQFFTASEVHGAGVVTPFVRTLTVPMVHAFGMQLLGLADERGWLKLELDLRNVTFLGAAALGLFVAVNKKLRSKGGRLTIRGVHPALFEVFKAPHLHRVFDIQQQTDPRPILPVAGDIPRVITTPW
jgi:anti-anti-sigma factor